MKRKRIAIIGTGISGLASAWFLQREHEVTVYEQEERLGGHSHTVLIEEHGSMIPVDTGFMVYNEVTYPLLTRLFRELDVQTKPTSMSFSVQHLDEGLEFNGGGLNLLFGQRRNLFNVRFWKMLMQIARFNRETVEELREPKFADLTLGDYVNERGYGGDFLRWYLSPMAAAVWSSPPEKIERFPARTLMRFWHNHGFLGLDTQHPWRTVSGGSRCYVKKLIKPFEFRIQKGVGVEAICRHEDGSSRVRLNDGTEREFDLVVVATHGDQAKRLLLDPTPLEAELLGKFHYQPNEAVVHTDSSVMPRTRRCWASWNYRVERQYDGSLGYSTHYWMNELQAVSERENYFVSINPSSALAAQRVKRRIHYEHPIFDLAAVAAQARLPELHREGGQTRRFFCGAWQRYGFHEDGLLSAVNVSTEILGRDPWL